MNPSRHRQTVLVVILALGAGLGSWALGRYGLHPGDQYAGPNDPGPVPQRPDLSQWPAGLSEELAELEARVADAAQPAGPLAGLGELYLANGFTTAAAQALDAAWQLDPHRARTAYLLGRIHLRDEAFAKAEAMFRAAGQLQPDYAPVWLHLGNISMRDQRFTEARSCFERRLALVPHDPEASLALAVLEQSAGMRAAAIDRLEAFVQAHPRLLEQRQLLAELHEAAGHPDEAEHHRQLLHYAVPTETAADPWMDALLEDSYDRTQLYLAGMRGVSAGEFARASRLLGKAAQLSPRDEEVHSALATAYLGLGQVENARDLLASALGRMPESHTLAIRLAEVLTMQSETEEALALLERQLRTAPENPDLHAARANTLDRMGRKSAAVSAWREAVRLDPVAVESRVQLGRSLLQSGDRTEGRKHLARALAMRPEHRGALALLAELALQEGHLDEAESHASILLALAPGEPGIRQFFAGVKFHQGNRAAEAGRDEVAAELYRAGLAVDPTSGRLHGALGMLLAKRGDLAAAMEHFERFAALAPADATPYLLIGSAHAQAGRDDAARAAFARGLALARKANDPQRSAQFERLLAPE